MTTPSANTPDDESGTGPVTIEDRVSSEGSPGSNQAKTEPMAPSGAHQEPLVPPELGDMNVGAADPQAPSHPAVTSTGASSSDAPGQGDDQGVPSVGTSPSPGSSEEHDVVTGIRLPDADVSSTDPA